MKAITNRLEWLEHYIRNSEPTDNGTLTVSKLAKEVAWSTIQEIRAIAEALDASAGPGCFGQGCICPPTCEKTCQAPLCPRRGLLAGGAAVRPEPIISLPQS